MLWTLWRRCGRVDVEHLSAFIATSQGGRYGPRMSDDSERRPRLRDAGPEVTGSAVGMLVQSVLGDEASGSVLAPLFASAIRVGQVRERQWWERTARTLEVAATESHVQLDELERRALADAARTELFARVVAAAGRTPLEAKIPGLGRVLARGLDAGARVDPAFIYAAALDDLEAPHVELLDLIKKEPSGPASLASPEDGQGWYPSELAQRMPTHGDVLLPVLRTLNRHALVVDPLPGSWPSDEGEHRVTLSQMGRACLDLLHA